MSEGTFPQQVKGQFSLTSSREHFFFKSYRTFSLQVLGQFLLQVWRYFPQSVPRHLSPASLRALSPKTSKTLSPTSRTGSFPYDSEDSFPLQAALKILPLWGPRDFGNVFSLYLLQHWGLNEILLLSNNHDVIFNPKKYVYIPIIHI